MTYFIRCSVSQNTKYCAEIYLYLEVNSIQNMSFVNLLRLVRACVLSSDVYVKHCIYKMCLYLTRVSLTPSLTVLPIMMVKKVKKMSFCGPVDLVFVLLYINDFFQLKIFNLYYYKFLQTASLLWTYLSMNGFKSSSFL